MHLIRRVTPTTGLLVMTSSPLVITGSNLILRKKDMDDVVSRIVNKYIGFGIKCSVFRVYGVYLPVRQTENNFFPTFL